MDATSEASERARDIESECDDMREGYGGSVIAKLREAWMSVAGEDIAFEAVEAYATL